MAKHYNLEIFNGGYSIYKAKKSLSILDIAEKDNVSKSIKNKKLNVLILGENISIDKLKINNLNHKNVDKIVENNLRTKFKNIEGIIYDYVVHEDYIVIYNINSSELSELKYFILKNKIIQIKPVQFCILEELRKSIKVNKYILIAKHDKYLYLLKIDNNLLIENYIREINSIDEEKSNLEIILEFETKINDQEIYLYGTSEAVNENIIENFDNIKVI